MFFYIILSWQKITVWQLRGKTTNDFLTNTRNHCEEVHKAFYNRKMTGKDFLSYCLDYKIFKCLENDKLVSSVSLSRRKYYELHTDSADVYLKKVNFVEVNYLYLNKEFNDKLNLRNGLVYGIKDIKNTFNLKDDFIIIAYLDPNYSLVNESFTILYSAGFNKGTFYKDEPCDFKKLFNMYDSFHDPLEILKDPSICIEEGNYMALFTTYKELVCFQYILPENILPEGVDLRKILTSRVRK